MAQHRRPSRADRKSKQVRNAIMVLGALAVIAVGAGYLYFTVLKSIRPIDERNFCPTDAKGPNSVTDVLVDLTDKFSPTQESAIRDRLDGLRDSSARYDMLEIYTVEPTKQALLLPVFSMCNPGRGEDINSWTGNPHLIEERWKSLFGDPLQHLFDSILVGSTAQISPIMESIQSVAVTRLSSQSTLAKKIPRKLIIISDLLQYVKDYSQYKTLGSFDDFKSSTYYQSVRADLSGVAVEIWYVQRKSTLRFQGDTQIDFWKNYFTDQGATIDQIWYVPGI